MGIKNRIDELEVSNLFIDRLSIMYNGDVTAMEKDFTIMMDEKVSPLYNFLNEYITPPSQGSLVDPGDKFRDMLISLNLKTTGTELCSDIEALQQQLGGSGQSR